MGGLCTSVGRTAHRLFRTQRGVRVWDRAPPALPAGSQHGVEGFIVIG